MRSLSTTLGRSGTGPCSTSTTGCCRTRCPSVAATWRGSPHRDTSVTFCRAAAPVSGVLDDSNVKYDRILQFVEQHTPLPVGASAALPADSSAHDDALTQEACWHHSYDEEADEGAENEDCDEEAMSLASDRAMLVRAAEARRQAAAHPSEAHPMAVYQAALLHARLATAAPLLAPPENTWEYGSSSEPKPWFFSYDEEAEGSFEEAYACNSSTESALQAYLAAQASKRAAHEARHAARTSRAVRRAALRASYGDLEGMDAWVDPTTSTSATAAGTACAPQRRSSRSQRHQQQQGGSYASLLPMAAEAVLKQVHANFPEARHPQSWQYTWDEEAHGTMGDSILSSC